MTETEFNINAQEYIIDWIEEHLKDGTVGRGIALSWDYTRKDGANIHFKLKEGAEVNLKDWFWFGFLTNSKSD